MGNIFPLSKKSSCFKATIKLIEASFEYKSPFSYEIDFAPLVDASNHDNCYIMLDENESVIAHIGTKERFIFINDKKYSVTLIGGIAVAEKNRGKGVFQSLFQDVIAEKRSDTSLFLLWSDLEKFYNKFGFYLCGTQFEYSSDKKESPFQKTNYQLLSEVEKKEIRYLYESSFSKSFLTLHRSTEDWTLIEKITSADLFLRKSNGKICDYYFINKGQDLPGIIYEYGTDGDFNKLIKEISSYGKVWTAKEVLPSETIQYQFLISPGDLRLFTDLVKNLTKDKFRIRNINIMKQEVYFDFDEETLVLECQDFLRGIFGPGIFEEIHVPALFLSGIDSI